MAEPNLFCKNTVLIGDGETVDILLDATNPRPWMAHCHIARRTQSGMMLSFTVPAAKGGPMTAPQQTDGELPW